MRVVGVLIALSPVLVIIFSALWHEFRHEVETSYSDITLKASSKKSRRAIEAEFPLVVEQFAILLGGNLSPATALDQLSKRTEGQFAVVLRDAVAQIRQGSSFAQALDLLSHRIDSPMVRRFCDSLLIAVERGSPLIEVVTRQVAEVRNEQRSRLMEAAGKAEIALMIPIVFLILPISVIFALWPSYFALGRSVGL